MSLEDVDDTGGYASGEILAYDSEGGGKGGLDATAVKKSLLRAGEVLQALDKQSRKRVLALSSDDSEPDDGESFSHFLPSTTTSFKRTKKNIGFKIGNQPA